MNFYALIVAAGKGSRFSSDLPKQYHMLNNRPVLHYALDTFSSLIPSQNILVCTHPTHEIHFQKRVKSSYPDIQNVSGGRTRMNSVYNGLNLISNKLNEGEDAKILIHDAARPLVSCEQVQLVMSYLENGSKACSLAHKVTNTLCSTDKDQKVDSYIPRENSFALETPQGFDFKTLWECHQRAFKEEALDFTDDTSLVHYFGTDVDLIENTELNLKLTTQHDFDVLELLLNEK